MRRSRQGRMDAFPLAITAAFLAALSRIIYRRLVLDGSDHFAILQIFSISAFFLVAIFLPMPQCQDISPLLWGALVANGAMWIIIGLLELRAYRILDASASAVYDCLSLVIIVFFGLILFQERFSLVHILGISLVGLALGLRAELWSQASRGLGYKLASVVLMTLTFSLDKYLSHHLPVSSILFFGYLFPALGYLLLRPRKLRASLTFIASSRGLVLCLPLLSVLRLGLTLQALSVGNLSLIYALLQTELVFVFLLELVFCGEIASAFRRMLSCTSCTAGALLLRNPSS